MAKTTTTTKKVDIVDLIRDRKLFPLLDVPPVRITILIEVTTSGLIMTPPPAPSAKMDRLAAAARKKLDEYESIITKECERFSIKIDGLMKAGKVKEAQTVTSEVNASVKNALRSAEGAAMQAVEEAKKKESQGDKLLTEARVKTAVKVTFGGISLAASAAKLAATSGADVSSYVSIGKTLISLGLELHQQIKGEESLRDDLEKGIRAYLKLRESVVMQAAKRFGLTNPGTLPGFPKVIPFVAESIFKAGKEVTKGRDKGQIAKEILDFTVKGVKAQIDNAEKSRQMYRNHTVKMRHHVDSVSAQADKLSSEMKKATNLKDGVKIGAACMQVKHRVTALGQELEKAIKYLADAEVVMKGLGLECDDRTIIEKIMALDKLTLGSEGAGLLSNLNDLRSLITNVAAAVA